MSLKDSMIRLKQELEDMTKNKVNSLISLFPQKKNFYIWDVILFGPPDTIFENAIIKGEISFPVEYPHKAPQFKFLTNLYHPNVYPDGKVCISIAHEGIDEFGEEDHSVRWTPTQTIETFLLSIISILDSPNIFSPANVDAGILYRDNREAYKKIQYRMVSETQK
jgi:ubiquitin-conjugating enzyme E2 G1